MSLPPLFDARIKNYPEIGKFNDGKITARALLLSDASNETGIKAAKNNKFAKQ
jgi:hypothetical protein